MKQWDLILDGAIDGQTNMAIDGALLDEAEKDPRPRTCLRFYSWARPTISLGRNQQLDRALDLEYCRDNGIDAVHRPTGGRAVLHDDELTYAVISNDLEAFGDSIYGNYKRVSEALGLGFRRLGIPALLAPDTRKPRATDFAADPPCFASPSRYELMVDGRKIVGSAQRRLRRSFLQHGSMPITVNREILARATRMPDPSVLYDEMAGSAEFRIPRPTLQELTGALMAAFQEYFNIDFRESPSRLSESVKSVL
jgi:lipoate-protein ligase A